MKDYSIIILGDCQKCGETDVGLKYTLRQLYRWAKEIKKSQPLQPPLAFDDTAFLHRLGIRYEED